VGSVCRSESWRSALTIGDPRINFSNIVGLGVTLAALVAPTHLTDQSTDKASDAVRHKLEANYEKLVPAIGRNDQAAMMNFYTDDAVLLSPDGRTITGRKEIADFYKEALAPGLTNKVSMNMVEVQRHGDIAFEARRYSWSVRQQGKPTETEKGTYMIIWKHQPGDYWKIYREVWNATTAP
jgi:uncharacterized protein (TIGR02246 family)